MRPWEGQGCRFPYDEAGDGPWSRAMRMWAQALIEKGMLDSMAAGFTQLRYKVSASISDGSILWWLAGAVVLFLVFRSRRR